MCAVLFGYFVSSFKEQVEDFPVQKCDFWTFALFHVKEETITFGEENKENKKK